MAYVLQPNDIGYDANIPHGLIVSSTDIASDLGWGCEGTSISTSFVIGSGAANTNAILAGCPTRPIAASAANDYTVGIYSDWYLPSNDEWQKIYDNRALIGSFTTGYYWTSTQYDGVNAFGCGFNQGIWSGLGSDHWGTKNDPNYIRAVRSF